MSDSVYVVQMREPGEVGEQQRWVDVVTVEVPAKTKRATVIRRAIERAPELRMHGEEFFRAIPAEHAEVIPAEWEQPPPQLRIKPGTMGSPAVDA